MLERVPGWTLNQWPDKTFVLSGLFLWRYIMNNISERKIFMKYLIPSMLSMMAVSAYSFVDTFVVGQGIGAQAVAAMGLGMPVVSILYALGFLLGAGGAVNYSVALGTGKKEKARSYFSAAFFITILLWIVIAVSGNIFIKELAVFLGAMRKVSDANVSKILMIW